MQIAFKEKTNEKFHLPKCLGFLKNFHSLFYYFLFLIVIGVLFFALSLFTNYFTTPFTGDYTSQQYAFYTNGYDDWWHFLTTGQFVLYDTNTFLGASNIGSNSFYYLFDPFFLPILIFPRSIIPQGIAILTIIKMALAGMTFRAYIKYFGVKERTARLAGFAYAFCGWTTWYLWFNHFTGVVVIFPVVLLGIEKVLKENKPYLLMFSLFVLGLTNFFFFFTFTVCAFLYAMWRYFQRIKENNCKANLTILGIGFAGFFVGCLLSCLTVVPATVVALNAPRATSQTYLSDITTALKSGDLGTVFYKVFAWDSTGSSYSYKTFYPIIDYIFPVMSDRGTPLTKLGNESYDNVAGSLFCFSPIIIFFVPALIYSFRKKKYSHIVATALFSLMLFTPFCYYAFHGFTYAYSRWTLFVTTSLITYVALYIDKINEDKKLSILPGSIFAVIITWVAVGVAIYITKHYSNFTLRYSYPSLGEYGFLIIEGVTLTLYIALFSFLFIYFYNKEEFKEKMMFVAISFEAIVMGATTLAGHGYENYLDVNNGKENNDTFQVLIDQIKKDDPTYYRCYSSQENSSARNDSMRHGYNGLGMFHSIYNFNDYGFLNWSEINDYSAPDSYSASYVEKKQNLDTFLGVKYYFVHKDKAFWGDEKAQDLKYEYYRANVPLGFEDISEKYPNDKYYVYENKQFINFAFSYDQVATYDDKDSSDESGKKIKMPNKLCSNSFQSEELYLRTAILGDSVVDKVKDKISQENINNYVFYESDLDVKQVNPFTYSTLYYDIHGDAEENRTDASSYNFVSNLLNLDEYPSSTTKPSTWKYNGRYVTVMTTNNSFPYDENGIVLYLKNSYYDENDINVYLVTEDNMGNQKFVTFDNHNDSHLTVKTSSRKTWRGFYSAPSKDEFGNFVPAPKISKIVVASRKTSLNKFSLYYDLGTNVTNRINALNQYAITDINYRTNHFDFKTNYSFPRVVVTQLPYEDGWKVTATTKDGKVDIPVFMAQGGYVSFVSETGDVSYSMDYYTPYLSLGSYASLCGLAMFVISYAGYVFINDEKRRKQAINSLKVS